MESGSVIPSFVTASIEALKPDVGTIGGLMFGVVLVVVAFAYFRRTAR